MEIALQEVVILEAEHVEESTDAVLKEHAIPAPLSEDLSHLLLENGSYFEAEADDENDEYEEEDEEAEDAEGEEEGDEDPSSSDDEEVDSDAKADSKMSEAPCYNPALHH